MNCTVIPSEFIPTLPSDITLNVNTFMFALMPALLASFCSSLYFKLSRSMSVDQEKVANVDKLADFPLGHSKICYVQFDWVTAITSLVSPLPVQTSRVDGTSQTTK